MMEEGKLVEIKSVNTGLVERANGLALAIQDISSCGEAIQHGQEIDRRLKWWLEWISPVVEGAYKTWKTATARREEIAGPLRDAKDLISRKAGEWQRAEEQKRRAAALKTQAQVAKEFEDAKIEQAAELEAAGQNDMAEAVLEAETVIPTVIQPKTKVDGASFRTTWDFEIINPLLVPREFLAVDMVAIRKVVTALKERATISGVRIFNKSTAVLKGDKSA